LLELWALNKSVMSWTALNFLENEWCPILLYML